LPGGVADHCGAEYQAILFRARDALALMDRVGEPLGDASFLPRYALALAAKQTATVMRWLRGPLRTILEDCLFSERVTRRGLFEPAMVMRLIAECVSGWRNHRKLLWTLLMFDAWCDHYLPNERWR